MKTNFDFDPHFLRVRLFNYLNGQPTPTVPTPPPMEQRMLRLRLIIEEAVVELGEAMGVTPGINVHNDKTGETMFYPIAGGTRDIDDDSAESWGLTFEINGTSFDLESTVDALTDGSVVLTGGYTDIGVEPGPCQEEVDLNNLAKFGPGGYRSNGEDGKPVGKWIKPPDHPAPDIKGAIEGGAVEVYDRVIEAIALVRAHSTNSSLWTDMVQNPNLVLDTVQHLWDTAIYYSIDTPPTTRAKAIESLYVENLKTHMAV